MTSAWWCRLLRGVLSSHESCKLRWTDDCPSSHGVLPTTVTPGSGAGWWLGRWWWLLVLVMVSLELLRMDHLDLIWSGVDLGHDCFGSFFHFHRDFHGLCECQLLFLLTEHGLQDGFIVDGADEAGPHGDPMEGACTRLSLLWAYELYECLPTLPVIRSFYTRSGTLKDRHWRRVRKELTIIPKSWWEQNTVESVNSVECADTSHKAGRCE